jgi:dynein heavy chain
MQAYKDILQKQILGVVQLVRGKLSRQLRTTLKALVVLDVHGSEVVQSLIDNQV